MAPTTNTIRTKLVCLVKARKARKNNSGEITLPEDVKPEKVMIDRNTVEVVAARVISLDPGNRKKARD